MSKSWRRGTSLTSGSAGGIHFILAAPGLEHRQAPPLAGTPLARAIETGDRQLAALHFDQLPTPELARRFAELVRYGFRSWDLLNLVTQGIALPVFREVCRRWLRDSDLSVGARLFGGLGGIPQTEAGLALWRLAELLHRDASVQQAVAHDDGWAAIRTRLERTAPGKEFIGAWNAFMAEHGHHCRGELELSNARWSEQPDYILRLIRGYAQSRDQSDPVGRHHRLQHERERLTEVCRQQMSGPVRRVIFSWSLRKTQRLALTREEWKNQAVRHIFVLRRILLILGTRLAEAGVLARVDDIFFINSDEVEAAVSRQDNQEVASLRDVIIRRRSEYEANRALSPPSIVRGRFDGAPAPELSASKDNEVLKGIPIYPGVVTGRARVILRADDQQQVLPGEVLIAPFTDPAWTPYFVTAAAVAVDQGGILSHGSIVAREYGLPAVPIWEPRPAGFELATWCESMAAAEP